MNLSHWTTDLPIFIPLLLLHGRSLLGISERNVSFRGTKWYVATIDFAATRPFHVRSEYKISGSGYKCLKRLVHWNSDLWPGVVTRKQGRYFRDCAKPGALTAPGQKWDFHTHSFALKVFRWLIVVQIFKTPAAKRSNSQHFWRVSRVESTLLPDRVVKWKPFQISTSDLACNTQDFHSRLKEGVF
jgi:hypothetical protein